MTMVFGFGAHEHLDFDVADLAFWNDRLLALEAPKS